MAELKEVKKWLEKAKNDYDFSSSILPESTFYAQICFFFQQSAEKYLKAFIVKNDLAFKKIHDLIELLKICQAHQPSFSGLFEDCRTLNVFYIDTRYPVHWPSNINKEEALKALSASKKIKEFVEALLE
ncbi:MAG: HEPN domain-containing protein [Candidatus Saganbacteria bacterium]|uniref:HEPN domain-containing protein n=1 Tax=Candidatus Saganbacteria bacterium TaxID=2575572 RepID=A0A833KZM6_UNCSA|nr:MAG: HEPN domain-containing protein [Candidatus Saganbacteria bacterium]